MRKDDYGVSLADIGREMIRASRFEEMYYELLEQHKELQQKYAEHLDKVFAHNQQMVGDFLCLALNMGENSVENAK